MSTMNIPIMFQAVKDPVIEKIREAVLRRINSQLERVLANFKD